MIRPILTISIPTYQRFSYLDILLKQLQKEVLGLEDPDSVEIIVSDNASLDRTREVVQQYLSMGLHFRYLRNTQNIGSDLNIAQAFNEAKGSYVLIMGDDDVLVDGALAELLARLTHSSPGIVLLKAYGYEQNYRSELPKSKSGYSEFVNAGKFLRKAGAQITLISACVINKEIIEPLDAKSFVGDNLVQVHLVLSALLAGSISAVSNGYVVACKRNNSGGYVYAEVFVKNLGSILDYYKDFGLSNVDIINFENHLLRVHHPYYIWRSIGLGEQSRKMSINYFDDRFKGRLSYSIFVAPQLYLPASLAWVWGLSMVVVGRVFFGDDLNRGVYFARHKFKSAWLFFRSSFKIMGNTPRC